MTIKNDCKRLLHLLSVIALMFGVFPGAVITANQVPQLTGLSAQAVAGTSELAISFNANQTVQIYLQVQPAADADPTAETFNGAFYAEFAGNQLQTFSLNMTDYNTEYDIFIRAALDTDTTSVLYKLTATTATAMQVTNFAISPIAGSTEASVSFNAVSGGTLIYYVQPASEADIVNKSSLYAKEYFDRSFSAGATTFPIQVLNYSTSYELFYFFENPIGGQTALTKVTFTSSPNMDISGLTVTPVAASKQIQLNFNSAQTGQVIYYIQPASGAEISDVQTLQNLPFENASVTAGANSVTIWVPEYDTDYEVFYLFENSNSGFSEVLKQTFTSASVLSISNLSTASVEGQKEVNLNFTSGEAGFIHYYLQPASESDLADREAFYGTDVQVVPVTQGVNSVPMTVSEFETQFEVFYTFENAAGDESALNKRTFTSGTIIDISDFSLTPQADTKVVQLSFTASGPATLSYVIQPAASDDLNQTTFYEQESIPTAVVTAGANSLTLTLEQYATDYQIFYTFKNQHDFETPINEAAFTTSATIAPAIQKVELDATRKNVYVHFNVALDSNADKTKVTLKNGTALVASSKFALSLASPTTLKITSTVVLGAFKLTFSQGAVRSDGSDTSIAATTETSYTAVKFPAIASTVVSQDNKTVTISFAKPTTGEPVLSASEASEVLNEGAGLKSFVTLSTNGKTYSALSQADSVSIANDQLTITFQQALSQQTTTLKLAPDALQMTQTGVLNSNLSGELKTANLDLTPTLVSSTLDPTNKIVSLKFSETLVNPSTSKVAAEKSKALRDGTRLATDGVSFTTEPSAVQLIKDTMIVTFSTKLLAGDNRIRVQNNVVVDVKKNHTGIITTGAIVADGAAPTVSVVGFNPVDKTLTVFFNEDIILHNTTLATFAGNLRYNTSSTFTTPSVSISKNRMTIRHKTPQISNAGNGGVTNLVIPAGTLKDAADNLTSQITTGAADGTGPVVTQHELLNSGNDLLIQFDGAIFPIANAIPLTAISITSGSGTTTVTNPISSTVWKTATTSITIVNGYSLKISNLKTALVPGNKVLIRKDILTDLALNKNAAIELTITTPQSVE